VIKSTKLVFFKHINVAYNFQKSTVMSLTVKNVCMSARLSVCPSFLIEESVFLVHHALLLVK